MKKPLMILLCLLLSYAAFSEGERESWTSGDTLQYDNGEFTAVETGWGIDVEITQSADFSVELFADSAVRDRIRIERFGRTLKISARNEFPWGWGLGVSGARVEIRMPVVEELAASGGSRLDVVMDNGEKDLLVRLSGGSALRGTVRTSGIMEIEASGGSSADIEGGAASLVLNGSGGTRYRLSRLPAGEARADLSGGSSAEVMVLETLSVDASGGSHVVYYGDPRIRRQDLSGGSWIRRE